MQKTVFQARLCLLFLWLSQTGRVLSDWCLRLFVVRQLAQMGQRELDSAWYLVTAICTLPFIILAPVNGALSNSLRKPVVLLGACVYCLGVVCSFTLLDGPWLWCLGLVSIGSAVYSPARYALLSAAARDTQLPLPRVTGWIELGSSLGIVAGAILGYQLYNVSWSDLPSWQARIPPPVVVTILVLNALTLLTVLPVRFPADIQRPEPALQAIAGFFRDGRRIFQERPARGSLLGLAALIATVTAGSGALVNYTLAPEFHSGSAALFQMMVLLAAGAALGSGLAGLQGHLRRCLGQVPLGCTGLLLTLAWAMVSTDARWPCLALGLVTSFAHVPLRSFYQAAVPPDARGNGMAVMNFTIFVMSILLALVMYVLTYFQILKGAEAQLGFLAILAAGGAILAWRLLLRDTVELLVVVALWPMYRLRVYGPGLELFPKAGPVLIISNHTAWLDPVWLGTILPRHITPMMTSIYYDKPLLRWFMAHVIRTIRVPDARIKQETPELEEAIAALNRGQCVLIFPEGMVRRRDDQLLRRFGRGIWHILHEQPQTPVVACWIEGGWGSYTSFQGGPPMKNKPIDLRRHIEIAIGPPQILDPKVLSHHHKTRSYLMRAVFDARKYMGLQTAIPEMLLEEEVAKESNAGQDT